MTSLCCPKAFITGQPTFGVGQVAHAIYQLRENFKQPKIFHKQTTTSLKTKSCLENCLLKQSNQEFGVFPSLNVLSLPGRVFQESTLAIAKIIAKKETSLGPPKPNRFTMDVKNFTQAMRALDLIWGQAFYGFFFGLG